VLALADDVPSGGDDLHASEDRVAVWSGLRKLHRREREALRCRYFSDMSQAEVASALGISQTHTSRLLASGLAKLRANLNGNEDFVGYSELHSGHGDSRRRPGRAA
jgi:RNA polymerase sigma-B factor